MAFSFPISIPSSRGQLELAGLHCGAGRAGSSFCLSVELKTSDPPLAFLWLAFCACIILREKLVCDGYVGASVLPYFYIHTLSTLLPTTANLTVAWLRVCSVFTGAIFLGLISFDFQNTARCPSRLVRVSFSSWHRSIVPSLLYRVFIYGRVLSRHVGSICLFMQVIGDEHKSYVAVGDDPAIDSPPRD